MSFQVKYAAVEFTDTKKGDRRIRKIAPIEYIRISKDIPFAPSSVKDFDRDQVYEVKWQKSTLGHTEDGQWDGYCDAVIICMAGMWSSVLIH